MQAEHFTTKSYVLNDKTMDNETLDLCHLYACESKRAEKKHMQRSFFFKFDEICEFV